MTDHLLKLLQEEQDGKIPESRMAELAELGEKFFLVKHLQEKASRTEKEEEFIKTVEAIELTDEERTIVADKFKELKAQVAEEKHCGTCKCDKGGKVINKKPEDSDDHCETCACHKEKK